MQWASWSRTVEALFCLTEAQRPGGVEVQESMFSRRTCGAVSRSWVSLNCSICRSPDIPSAAVDHPTLQIKREVARTARSKGVARGSVTRWLARAEAGGAVVS